MDLFDDSPENMQKALDAASFHWGTFAARYKGIPSSELSFDLINEPPHMEEETRYIEVVKGLVDAIRKEDPQRLIVADGKNVGMPFHRKLLSDFTNFFADKLLNLNVGDSMSGFFALRKSVFERSKPFLKPRGYKILLEILVKSESSNVVEIPLIFQKRFSGKTKANIKVFTLLVLQLADCFVFKFQSRF